MPRPSTPKRDGASGHTASPEELAYPGAGTLFVHGIVSDDATSAAPPRRGISPRRSPARRAGRSKESARSRSRSVLRQQDLRRDEPRIWDDIVNVSWYNNSLIWFHLMFGRYHTTQSKLSPRIDCSSAVSTDTHLFHLLAAVCSGEANSPRSIRS